jgi:tRNA 2-selenouridine synthase
MAKTHVSLSEFFFRTWHSELFMTVVPFAQELIDTHLVVDVRTPLEFMEDHIPGAVNVPLLSNEERVEIGTLYKQEGPHPARVRGLEITAPKLPSIVAEIAAAADGWPILVCCWRGGLRSRTVAAVLELTGYPVVQLAGGYKSYRKHITCYFELFRPPGLLVILHGLTGIGKTTFLDRLQGNGPWVVIDLEGLASHRGSAFGMLGLEQNLTQKHFESLLWDAFRRVPPGTPVILEGESRRIGRVALPGDMYEVMRDGVKIWCEASLETRVRRLLEDYGREEYRAEMTAALDRIRKKLGGEKYLELSGYLQKWELEPFVRELCVSYYDRNYYKVRDWTEDAVISLEDYTEAAVNLEEYLNTFTEA